MAEESETPAPPPRPETGIRRKSLMWIGGITAVIWAFTIYTGSGILAIIVGALTLVLAYVLYRAFGMVNKQRKLVNLLQGSTSSPEARRDAIAKLSEGKDANSPINLFARAQLVAADNPQAALDLLSPVELKTFPPAMQDDVSLLKTQLFLGLGRTADARKQADTINLDNPSRAESRSLGAAIVGEAWARTGKPKEALALLDSIVIPKGDPQQIGLQSRIARVFARFAANQRNAARTELVALADENLDYLARFLLPQFRVHPELQKLARRVLDQHPSRRKMVKVQQPK